MRRILSLLVVANVFAFALLQDWLSPWVSGEREPRRLAQQRDPDRLRVVPLDRLGAAPARSTAGPSRGAPARAAPPSVTPARPAPAVVAPAVTQAVQSPPGAPVPQSSGVSAAQSSPAAPERLPEASGTIGGQPGAGPAAEPTGTTAAIAADAACVAFGSLDEPRANRLRTALEAAGARVELTRVEQAASYFVYAPPADTLAEAQRRLAELRRIGQDDVFLMQEGALRHGISVGLYRSQDMARALVTRLESLGQTGLQVVPRGAVTVRVRLQARWPDPAAAAAAPAIAARFDVPVRDCG